MHIEPFWMAPFEGLNNLPVLIKDWTTQDFIREIRLWTRIPIVLEQFEEQKYLAKLQKIHLCHSLWLEYYLVEMPAYKREELRTIIHFSDCITGKADADFSLAMIEMCRQVFGKSELLTQAPSFEHLWFLGEYSKCLPKISHSGLLTGRPTCKIDNNTFSKDDIITANHESIRIYEQALIDNYLETEQISSNQDWCEEFVNILIAESVTTAIKNRDRDLKQHCRQFLKACRNYNAVIEGENFVVCYFINGQLHKSLPGGKSIPLPSTEAPRSVGRPIGSRNKKKGFCKEI